MHLTEFESSKLRGLMGRRGLPAGHALHLRRCRSVHTCFMRFRIDLVWLDGDGRPIRLDRDVAPWRVRTCLQARSVLECAAGCGERFAAVRSADVERAG